VFRRKRPDDLIGVIAMPSRDDDEWHRDRAEPHQIMVKISTWLSRRSCFPAFRFG
jgi:hypothetical protein